MTGRIDPRWCQRFAEVDGRALLMGKHGFRLGCPDE